MKRPILYDSLSRWTLVSLLFVGASSLYGQQSAPITGVSQPPRETINIDPDETGLTPVPQRSEPLPSAATDPATATTPLPENTMQPSPTAQAPVLTHSVGVDPDAGIVETPASSAPSPRMTLRQRNAASDPDGDVVRPHAAEPGEILAGTTIRVRLLDRISTSTAEKGQKFRSQVASDVLSGGLVLIPTGSEIDGQIVQVSSGGHLGSSGSMRLHPETVILPDGSSYQFRSDITGTPGSKTHMGNEGTIKPGSRTERDAIEYGGAVGVGAITGAVVAGPIGAVTGGLVGAGVVTAHLLINHPQAVLETGTVLLITLTDPLRINPLDVQQR